MKKKPTQKPIPKKHREQSVSSVRKYKALFISLLVIVAVLISYKMPSFINFQYGGGEILLTKETYKNHFVNTEWELERFEKDGEDIFIPASKPTVSFIENNTGNSIKGRSFCNRFNKRISISDNQTVTFQSTIYSTFLPCGGEKKNPESAFLSTLKGSTGRVSQSGNTLYLDFGNSTSMIFRKLK